MKRFNRKWIVCLLTCSVLVATQSSTVRAAETAQAVPSAPATQPTLQATQNYKLGPEDVLGVAVQGEPNLSVDQVAVSSAGKIRLPMVGDVPVGGKTLNQVTDDIKKALRAWLKRPEVTVALRQARPQRIFVLGA